MNRVLFPLLLTLLLILSLSCSGSPPEIINTEWMVVYTRDLSRGAVYSELNVFAQMQDDDGIEDISEVSIHRDDLGWSWNLTASDWSSFSREGEDWIGSNGLTLGAALPGGDYRFLAVDRSGQRHETLFKVRDPGMDMDSLVFPELQIRNGILYLSGRGYEPLVLWFYNDKGILITEKYTGSGVIPLNEIISPEEKQIARWLMIYYQDETGGYGLKTGPYFLDENREPSTGAEGKTENPS
ncbi:MAG: hypothetical protein PQJ58_22370 [Spirochaetales bacterium]|nr:hypothetical protein [Spirochaetales bacterium]